MLKAKNFWLAVEEGHWINPFNIQPTVRPPGTILMSYPLGFSPDFHGFHFRSVFLPILCVIAAVYLVSGIAKIQESGWWVAAIAFLLSSLPMFYQFDLNEDLPSSVYWGLVDNFQAGIAALAVAAIVRNLMTRSLPWLWVGSFLACFTLCIKPSGLMIMALIVMLWLTAVAIEWRWSSTLRTLFPSFRVFLYKRVFIFLVFYVATIVLSFSSKYLSKSNIAFGKQALAVMREMLQIQYYQFFLLFRQISGVAVILWIFVIGVLFLYLFFKSRKEQDLQLMKILTLLILSLGIWSLGTWYWLVVQAGGSQIRYFSPFMLMGLICVIPAALHVWSQTNTLVRVVLFLCCITPALNLTGLLAAGDSPSFLWQRKSGVNVSVGNDKDVVQQAYIFLDELRKSNVSAQVYSFADGVPPSIFENVGTYERLISPDLASFTTVLAIDWLRGFAVRVEELLDCDYLLIRKYGIQKSEEYLELDNIDSFHNEIRAFEVWLSTLDDKSGVETFSDGSSLRLLRISDRAALARSIDNFVSERVWRPEFVLANKPVFWWNADTLFDYNKKPDIEEVRFENIYILHALAMHRMDNELKVEFWWEDLKPEEVNKEWYLFLHLVDTAGNIIDNKQVALYPYHPPFENRRWRHGEVIFKLKPQAGTTLLAFGIYQLSGNLLLADKGNTDWDGKRVLIKID
jgi:hypothetical protein